MHNELKDLRPLRQRFLDGKNLRKQTPRRSHGGWVPSSLRIDPIRLLLKTSANRLPDLLPIRYGRMLQSPFNFFRGAAALMAHDLDATPRTGVRVQACGDCHLLNFGAFASPERRMIFDINDFDETLPGFWEWDIKRLAASFAIASQHNGFRAIQVEEVVRACLRSYRKKMAEFSLLRALETWYYKIELDTLVKMVKEDEARKNLKKRIYKATHRHVVEDDFPKLAFVRGQQPSIRDNPPLIFHPQNSAKADFKKRVKKAIELYRQSLPDDRRVLHDRYELKDIAMKVVGVGSVGTWCGILLLMAGPQDPLFLQVKEALPSVLEPYMGKSTYRNHGRRVVEGQRLMQSASDIFLGWTEVAQGRHFYIRQLRDMKVKPMVETYSPPLMKLYAEICGWTLARAHAKSGDAARISGYLGKNEVFDEAVTDFALRYSIQNEKDHHALAQAVKSGKIRVNLER